MVSTFVAHWLFTLLQLYFEEDFGATGRFGATGKRYKLFWMGSEAKTEGFGIFVAEKWVDSVVSVKRHSERMMVLQMVLGDHLLNVFTVYAPPGNLMR